MATNKIEKFSFETDEDYKARCEAIGYGNSILGDWAKNLSEVSNLELCRQLKVTAYKCGVLGYHEYVIQEAINRLQRI